MKRREFIAALGGAAGWPLLAQAQHPALPVVGFLGGGTPDSDAFRVAAVRQSLKDAGYKPSDLPVQQSTKVEFIINLKTAKAIGLKVPPMLLARADEVIE